MSELKAEVLFNRALLWAILTHLTDSKIAAWCFTLCGVLTLARSLRAVMGE